MTQSATLPHSQCLSPPQQQQDKRPPKQGVPTARCTTEAKPSRVVGCAAPRWFSRACVCAALLEERREPRMCWGAYARPRRICHELSAAPVFWLRATLLPPAVLYCYAAAPAAQPGTPTQHLHHDLSKRVRKEGLVDAVKGKIFATKIARRKCSMACYRICLKNSFSLFRRTSSRFPSGLFMKSLPRLPDDSPARGAYAAFGQHPDRSRAEEPVREGKSGGRAGRTTRRAPRRSPAPMCCDPRRPRVYPGRHQRPPGAGSTFEFPRLECREAGSIHSTAWGARPARRGLPCPRRGPRGARPYSRAW